MSRLFEADTDTMIEDDEVDHEQQANELRAQVAGLQNQVNQLTERETDHQVRAQVLGDKLKEADEQNTNLRIMATKLNIENQNYKQILAIDTRQEVLPAEPAPKPRTTRGKLKSTTAH